MSQTTHTPGPWIVTAYGSFMTEVRAERVLGRKVAGTWVQGASSSREGNLKQAQINEANARLIAAAPELLEAAHSMMARWPKDQHADSPLYDEALAMRAAIAKATGAA